MTPARWAALSAALGVVLVLAGVALVYGPAALVLAGAAFIRLALFIEGRTSGA